MAAVAFGDRAGGEEEGAGDDAGADGEFETADDVEGAGCTVGDPGTTEAADVASAAA